MRGSSGCSTAGPCGFARVCPLYNCIMIVIILDITYDSLQVYNCLVIMEFRLHVGFVGPQRCWSGRFRRCLSLVLRCYDISLGIQ